MSSGQLPRTPKHFPKMKYRARKRVHRAVEQLWIDSAPAEIEPDIQSLASRCVQLVRAAVRRETAGHRDHIHVVPDGEPRFQTYSYPDRFPERPVDKYTLDALQINRTKPHYIRTVVLNPNVRKRR